MPRMWLCLAALLSGCAGGVTGDWQWVEALDEPDVVFGSTWLHLQSDGNYERAGSTGMVFESGTWTDDAGVLTFVVEGGTEAGDDWSANYVLDTAMDDLVRRDTLELDRTEPIAGQRNPTLWMRRTPGL